MKKETTSINKIKKISFLIVMIMLFLSTYSLKAQMSINTDGSSANASAMLEVKSTTKGFLPPRMTASQIENIASPANGLMVFNTTGNKLYIFVLAGNVWKEVNYGAGTIAPPFTCGDALVDERDSKSYATVQIGTQCWMAENLNVGTSIDGSGNQADNGTIEKYCYGDISGNCDTYGGLYQWNEMMQYVTTAGAQGICPNGWHIPTDDEWKTMEMHLGMAQAQANATGWRGTDEGGKLKETGTTHWYSPNTGATNSSGFTALPAGYRGSGAAFGNLGTICAWWSTTENSSSTVWYRRLGNDYDQVGRDNYGKTSGFSVRCLKN